MAKPAKNETVETPNLPATTMDDLYACFSEEERAELLAVSGQAGNTAREKIPRIVINYCTMLDKAGKSIKEGNFVIFQDTSVVEVEAVDEDGDKVIEKRVESIGIDLGKSPKVIIYTAGTNYAFFPGKDSTEKGKEHICLSQLVFDTRTEKHVGSKLGFECQSGQCPRRQKDVKKADKCGAQFQVFCEATLPDGEKVKALIYIKGSSYMPYADYLKEISPTPIFFAPTKLSAKQEISTEGKPYYVFNFKMMKDQAFTPIEAKANFDFAKQTQQAAEAYKKEQKNRKPAAQLAHKNEGRFAREIVQDDDVESISFD